VSDDLREQIDIRFDRIEDNIAVFRRVLDAAHAGEAPKPIELSGLAFFLQSFYTETEAIFKLIADDIDSEVPDSDSWHQDLLAAMAKETANRPPVISGELNKMLRDFLNFRHFSRYATAFTLDWDPMAPLVVQVENTLKLLKTELREFLDRIR